MLGALAARGPAALGPLGAFGFSTLADHLRLAEARFTLGDRFERFILLEILPELVMIRDELAQLLELARGVGRLKFRRRQLASQSLDLRLQLINLVQQNLQRMLGLR